MNKYTPAHNLEIFDKIEGLPYYLSTTIKLG